MEGRIRALEALEDVTTKAKGFRGLVGELVEQNRLDQLHTVL